MDIAQTLAQLEALIPFTETRDTHFLRRDLRRLKRERTPEKEAVEQLQKKVVESAAKTDLRRQNFPP